MALLIRGAETLMITTVKVIVEVLINILSRENWCLRWASSSRRDVIGSIFLSSIFLIKLLLLPTSKS